MKRAGALAAIVSLALGIGANTAVFSVANGLLIRPLAYADADRLAILWNRSPGLNIEEDWFSTAQYFDIKAHHTGFEQLAIAIGSNLNLTGDGDPERVGVIRVSSNLLPMLGARPQHGHLFVPDDDLPGRSGTAVLSHGFWLRRFGGDAGAIGRTLLLNGQSYQIAGVLPPWFRLPREVMPTLGVAEDGEIFLPLPLPIDAPGIRTREDYNILAKLKRGVMVDAAQAEMDVLTARLRQEHPDVYPPHGGLTFSIVPLHQQVVGGVRTTVLVLSAAVAFVLLIACANVGNLLLSGAIARRREMAIRSALGATRSAIARHLLGEALLLSGLGGAVGVVLAWAGVSWIRILRPSNVPRLDDISIDATVLMFTLTACVVSGLVAGVAPILGLRSLDLQRTLAGGNRGSADAGSLWGRGGRLRRVLLVAQTALAVMLLAGAGLLVRTMANLQRVEPGFVADDVMTFELTMTGQKYANGSLVIQAYRDLWERLHRLPDTVAAGGVTSLPLAGQFAWGPLTVEGRVPQPGESFINADQRIVGGRYFEAMQIPLVAGRYFTEADTTDSERVVIVDEFMARELWPGAEAVGKRVRFGDLKSTAPWHTVVGVVGRVKQYGLDSDGRIAVYRAHAQAPARPMYVAVRFQGDPTALATGIRESVRALDPLLPIYRMRPMTSLVQASLARQRFAMQLMGMFAALALVLAALGVYSAMAYVVSQGTRELGIRMALGATSGGVASLVLRRGLTVTLIGIVLGLAGGIALARIMQSLVFGVGVADPLTFASVGAVLLVAGALATLVPALRAAHVDPAVAMKD